MATGNQQIGMYSRMGGQAAAESRRKVLEIFYWLGGEGSRTYNSLLSTLSEGGQIKPTQKEFMDRYERLLEYHAPKLARTVVEGDIKADVTVHIKRFSDGRNDITV